MFCGSPAKSFSVILLGLPLTYRKVTQRTNTGPESNARESGKFVGKVGHFIGINVRGMTLS